MNECSKVAEHRFDTQKSVAFVCTNMNNPNLKLRKQFYF